MGIMDKGSDLTDKAKAALGNDDNVDKLAEKADSATGGKHTDHIEKGSDIAKAKNDGLE